ncbi:hypothetical protein HC891_15200 [Candidatus Gracilibacteria bacterium]|nr:hypothetical protein [Candidatus Gracilibacteria bacterium]
MLGQPLLIFVAQNRQADNRHPHTIKEPRVITEHTLGKDIVVLALDLDMHQHQCWHSIATL